MKLVILEAEKREVRRFCKEHRVPLVLRESSNDFFTSRPRWQCPECQDAKVDREFRQFSKRH